MTNETEIDFLQLVPHRIKVLKLLYGTRQGASQAVDHTTVQLPTRQEGLKKAKSNDELRITKRINTVELR